MAIPQLGKAVLKDFAGRAPFGVHSGRRWGLRSALARKLG